MINTIISRAAHCVVGYLWAAFVAAIAITLFRAAQDLSSNAVGLADLPLYLVSLVPITTASNIINTFMPALFVIVALEMVVLFARFAAIRSLYMLAGAACGYYLTTGGSGARAEISSLEVMFHVASWTLGGLAFWYMAADRSRSTRES